MLRLNQTNRLTFTMDVLGTSATPTARVLVGGTPALSYPATKLTGTSWETSIDLPEGTKVGNTPFKVEVIINGRIFHPISTMIEIGDGQKEEVRIIQPTPATVQEPAAEPAPEPAMTVHTEAVVENKPKAKLLAGLENVAKKKPKPLPLPEIKIAKISIKEIANVQPPSVIKEAAVRETTRVVRTGPPIRLVKGEIIYK